MKNQSYIFYGPIIGLVWCRPMVLLFSQRLVCFISVCYIHTASFITVLSYDVRKKSNILWPDVRICLLALYTTSLSSSCRRIWRCWTCQVYSVECVSKIKSILSIIFVQYMGLRVFSLSSFLMMIARIGVLYLIITIIKSEVWPICHCLGFDRETMICTVCLSIFVWCYPCSVTLLC